MKLATSRHPRGSDTGSASKRPRRGTRSGVIGTARVDRRTKNLTARLGPGDVAIIDHVDLDRGSADALIAAKVKAVVNAAPSISGRYPNLGPGALVGAGIPLVDGVGKEIFGAVRDGTRIRLDGGTVYVDDEPVATGTRQDRDSVASALVEAKSGLSSQLEAFAANTMEFMRRERALLLDGVGLPDIRTVLEHRPCLVVARGYDYKSDLAGLRHYIKEYKPRLIGVDGGADALVEAGYRPHLIIGDMDSVSDETLRCGAEVIVHAYPDGRAPGLERVLDLGVEAITFPAAGTSEDMAMLLADGKGASLVIVAGMHATPTEFLDRGRGGMASTFLTRLKLGAKLVDAKAAAQMHRTRISAVALMMVVVAALVALLVVLAASATGRNYLDIAHEHANSTWHWVQDLFR
ncbi:MAG: putative cytokinetic ring protein SteA [Mycobacteriales bacterium]